MFFDSHCHLSSDALASQLPGVLQRAHDANVTRVLNIGDTIESSQASLSQIETAKNHGVKMRASAGIHPQNALQFSNETIGVLRELAQNENIVTIGEIGLDFVYDDKHEHFPGVFERNNAGESQMKTQVQNALRDFNRRTETMHHAAHIGVLREDL